MNPQSSSPLFPHEKSQTKQILSNGRVTSHRVLNKRGIIQFLLIILIVVFILTALFGYMIFKDFLFAIFIGVMGIIFFFVAFPLGFILFIAVIIISFLIKLFASGWWPLK